MQLLHAAVRPYSLSTTTTTTATSGLGVGWIWRRILRIAI